jgi:hypothetical protein
MGRDYTVATNGPSVHPSDDKRAWTTIVELYRQGKVIRPPQLSENPTNSNLVANQEDGKGNNKFGLRNIFVHISK